MNENYFSIKAEMAKVKIHLCDVGLSLCDELTTKEEIADELEMVIKKYEEIENSLYRKAPTSLE